MSKWEISPFGPTRSSGVYCVMCGNVDTKKNEILYIGSSKNIYKRVMSPLHPYKKLYQIINYPFLVYIKYKECDNYRDLEKILIKRLKPQYNLQHTGIEFRSYKIAL